ncbi:MAG: hypothetical protein J6D26_01020 [Clostridia bacterium]|nr:hypothetical protein [Clostridia bacterium]
MSIQQQLQKITSRIDLRLSQAAQEIMLKTKEKLKESVNESWYSTYHPSDYVRTYELINAINGRVIKNSKGNYTIEVYFDENLMSTKSSTYGWGTHVGFNGGDFRKGLISSIIHGMGGSKTNPRYGESTNVIDVVKQEAERYANNILRKYL